MAVPHFDPILLEFIQYNIITIGFIFGILTAIAKTFKLKKISDLVNSLKGVFFSIKNGQPITTLEDVAADAEKKENKESYNLS